MFKIGMVSLEKLRKQSKQHFIFNGMIGCVSNTLALSQTSASVAETLHTLHHITTQCRYSWLTSHVPVLGLLPYCGLTLPGVVTSRCGEGKDGEKTMG